MARARSPLRVHGGEATTELIVQLVHELPHGLLDDLHPEVVPELALEDVGRPVHGPRSRLQRMLSPDALKEDAQAPVAHAVAEEQEVTVAELVEDLKRDQALDRALRQVADVIVLGDDEVVTQLRPARPQVGRAAVQLDDDRPLEHSIFVDREVHVLVRHRDRPGVAAFGIPPGNVYEPAAVPPRRDEDDEIVRLVDSVEGPLEGVVVVGRDEQLVALASELAQPCRHAREVAMDGTGYRLWLDEQLAQRPAEIDPALAQRHMLCDAGEVVRLRSDLELARKVAGQFPCVWKRPAAMLPRRLPVDRIDP